MIEVYSSPFPPNLPEPSCKNSTRIACDNNGNENIDSNNPFLSLVVLENAYGPAVFWVRVMSWHSGAQSNGTLVVSWDPITPTNEFCEGKILTFCILCACTH